MDSYRSGAVLIRGTRRKGRTITLDYLNNREESPNIEVAKQRALRALGYYELENIRARRENPSRSSPFERRLEEAKMHEDMKQFGGNVVSRAAAMIERDVPPGGWDDLVGVDDIKKQLSNEILIPMLRPDIFVGSIAPSKYILFHGPPGTGKTTLVKVLASKLDATFFNMTPSSLLDKYVGVSESTAKCAFVLAKILQPSIIFMDECEAILGRKSGSSSSSGHASGGNILSEFRTLMGGITTDEEARVFVIAATNHPTHLDGPMYRRFTVQVEVPLPDFEARLLLIRREIGKHNQNLSEHQLGALAFRTDGYSGAELKALCSAAIKSSFQGLDEMEVLLLDKKNLPKLTPAHFFVAMRHIKPVSSLQ